MKKYRKNFPMVSNSKDCITRIGLDIGGVIMYKKAEKGSLSDFLASRPIPFALDSIKELIEIYSPENLFIISKRPDYAEAATIKWLEAQGFFDEIGFFRSNIYFCRERSEKVSIAKKLRLTHFIDDRIDVLESMLGVVEDMALFGVDYDVTAKYEAITVTDKWRSIVDWVVMTSC